MPLILYIDDNRNMRENGTEILELEGYEVIIACNGQEGFVLARERKPHLILCDVIMPVQDGYETIKQLKSDPVLSKIPFIFVTASAEKSEMSKGLELGAFAYIRKPFDGEELLSVVKQGLDTPKN
jgi:CRP/FNR family cyclic AMP-dependent transcriptional regulator